jgi:N-acetylneuraminate synthase
MKTIQIDGRLIGPNQPPYVVAELSANHNGSLDRALQTINMALKMGANAVKLQTYTAETMTIECENEDFQIHGGLWDGYSLYNLYKWAQTPFEWHKTIFEYARKIGITCFSTPFDETAVDLLEDLNVPAYKIASFEIIDLPLIQYIAQTGKPIIISTGMANIEEIQEAVTTAREEGCSEIALLHCVSGYPVPPQQCNLKTIPDLAEKFDIVPGLSDHTLGTTISIASIALGACLIEKHVTLSRADKGPDSEFSLEPDELEQLCSGTKEAWTALGKAGYDRKPAEESSIKFRRSIYTVMDIKAGEEITKDNIRRIRPGFGLSPKYFQKLLGKKAKISIPKGTSMKWEYLL